jgi:hypothetical protein
MGFVFHHGVGNVIQDFLETALVPPAGVVFGHEFLVVDENVEFPASIRRPSSGPSGSGPFPKR